MNDTEKQEIEKLSAQLSDRDAKIDKLVQALDSFKKREQDRILTELEAGIDSLSKTMKLEKDAFKGKGIEFIRGALFVADHYSKQPRSNARVLQAQADSDDSEKELGLSMDSLTYRDGKWIDIRTGKIVKE